MRRFHTFFLIAYILFFGCAEVIIGPGLPPEIYQFQVSKNDNTIIITTALMKLNTEDEVSYILVQPNMALNKSESYSGQNDLVHINYVKDNQTKSIHISGDIVTPQSIEAFLPTELINAEEISVAINENYLKSAEDNIPYEFSDWIKL